MEAIANTLIGKLVTMGGGYILASVMLWLYLDQRKTNNKLAEAFIQATKDQSEMMATTREVLRRVEEVLRETMRKF